jgi:hypothetical protein
MCGVTLKVQTTTMYIAIVALVVAGSGWCMVVGRTDNRYYSTT